MAVDLGDRQGYQGRSEEVALTPVCHFPFLSHIVAGMSYLLSSTQRPLTDGLVPNKDQGGLRL